MKSFLVVYQVLNVLLKDSIKLLFKSSENDEYIWCLTLGYIIEIVILQSW